MTLSSLMIAKCPFAIYILSAIAICLLLPVQLTFLRNVGFTLRRRQETKEETMKRKRKRKVWFYDEQVLMLWSSVYDDKWLTSTMFMMNPSQHNLPHRKFTDGIPMAWSYPGPWDTFLTLIENFLVGEYWQVASLLTDQSSKAGTQFSSISGFES